MVKEEKEKALDVISGDLVNFYEPLVLHLTSILSVEVYIHKVIYVGIYLYILLYVCMYIHNYLPIIGTSVTTAH